MKYANEIKAMVDGLPVVEYRYRRGSALPWGEWKPTTNKSVDITLAAQESQCYDFRIQPEKKPLVKSFANVYLDGTGSGNTNKKEADEVAQCNNRIRVAVLEVIMDPNKDNEVSTVIHKL